MRLAEARRSLYLRLALLLHGPSRHAPLVLCVARIGNSNRSVTTTKGSPCLPRTSDALHEALAIDRSGPITFTRAVRLLDYALLSQRMLGRVHSITAVGTLRIIDIADSVQVFDKAAIIRQELGHMEGQASMFPRNPWLKHRTALLFGQDHPQCPLSVSIDGGG